MRDDGATTIITLSTLGALKNTGTASLHAEVGQKRLEFLQEVVQRVARVAVLHNCANPTAVAQLHETQVAAQAMGVDLLILEPHSPDEFARVFAAMSQAGAGALLVLSAPFLLQWQLPSITALAQQHRLPAIYPHRMYMDAVGLMYYGTSLREAYRHTAYYDVGGSIDPIAACGGQAAVS